MNSDIMELIRSDEFQRTVFAELPKRKTAYSYLRVVLPAVQEILAVYKLLAAADEEFDRYEKWLVTDVQDKIRRSCSRQELAKTFWALRELPDKTDTAVFERLKTEYAKFRDVLIEECRGTEWR